MELSADDLPRFMQCNGYRLMPVAEYDGEESDARKEGIAAHWLAQVVYAGEFSDTTELIDRKAPNGVYITPEIAEAVDTYLVHILKRSPVTERSGKMEVVTTHQRGTWKINGRADHIELVGDTLYVDDFKFGWSIIEPEENWTLISHALGWTFANARWADWYVFTVIQPRPYHPSSCTRTYRLSRNEVAERFAVLNEVLTRPSDQLRTGDKCYRCPSLGFCHAGTVAGYNAVDASTRVIPEHLSGDDLSSMLDEFERAESVLKEKIKALEELAKYRIKSGEAIKNRYLENSTGNRKWNDGLSVSVVSAVTGVDVSKPGFITPAQAKKLGVSDDVLSALTHRPTTGIKLIREDANKRARRLLKNAG